GGSRSSRVTLKDFAVVFCDASRAVHVTAVVPTAKRLPEPWSQARLTPGALSLAVVGGNVTAALANPGSLPTVMSAGTLSVGACVSLTVTGKLFRTGGLVLALQVTKIFAIGNKSPLIGEQEIALQVPLGFTPG